MIPLMLAAVLLAPMRPVDMEPVRPLAVRGVASWMPEAYGLRYLALPAGPGHRVRVCGAASCLVLRSNDAGPDRAMQRRGRIADIGVTMWERLTGLPRTRGLAPVTVEYLP